MTDETRLAQIEARIANAGQLVARRDGLDSVTDATRADIAWLIEQVTASRARVRELETALRPFATFWNQWQRKPLSGMADTFYAIHTGTEYAAELRRSDCERAAALLSEEPIHDR